MIGSWLFAAATPSILDSFIRALLISGAKRGGIDPETVPVDRWTVLIPARQEGENLRPTLESVRAALDSISGSGAQPRGAVPERDAETEPPPGSAVPKKRASKSQMSSVAPQGKRTSKAGPSAAGAQRHRLVVVLDGPDPVGERIAREFGADVLKKEPAGPTKAAALAWAAEEISPSVPSASGLLEAVLILDVGSRLEDHFLEKFRWKRGSHAMQSMISGKGIGAGDAAAVSERVAQSGEDVGRERLGWAVRLRGTGTALRPEILREIGPLLGTQVEDLEASLLLAAAGRKLTMSGARIFDEKPEDVSQAAAQRARWFAGKLQVLTRHPDAILRLIQRNPPEGVAFVCEVLGRPLALSALLRCAAAGALLAEGRSGWRVALAGAALGSVALDVVVHARQGASVGSGLKIFSAWTRALALAPRSLSRWTKARTP